MARLVFFAPSEIMSLVGQVRYAFSKNKLAESPSNIVVSGLGEEVTKGLQKISGTESWLGFFRTQECLLRRDIMTPTTTASSSSAAPEEKKSESSEVKDKDSAIKDSEVEISPIWSQERFFDNFKLDREKTIYLTADTDDVLEELDPTCTYIIGGIVDKNRMKNATQKKADHYGLKKRKLPIAEHMTSDLGSFSKVLTVNHMVEILLTYQSTKNWNLALETAMPKRRIGEGEPKAKKRKLDAGEEQSSPKESDESAAATESSDAAPGPPAEVAAPESEQTAAAAVTSEPVC